MKYLTPPFIGRRVHFLLLGGLVLLLSCQSDPIVFNPPGGYEYNTKSFPLNNETSETVQGELHTGMSPRLYGGILSNGDMVSTLIRLSPEVLNSHKVCSEDSISKVNISLFSITQLAEEDTNLLIQQEALKIYLISLSEIWNEDVVLDSLKLAIISASMDASTLIPDSLISITNQSLEIQLFNYDSGILSNFCGIEEKLGIVVSYIPIDSSYLEFYSSNSNEGPRLSVEYTAEEETSKNHTRYLINEASWSDEFPWSGEQMPVPGPYFVKDSLSGYWGTFYALSLDLENQIITNPPLVYDSITVQTDIISAGQNSPLVTIKLDLNPEIINDIDSISFSILNAFAFISDLDPAGDNFSESDSTGSEGNGVLDWTDENGDDQWNFGEGEEWFDHGEDNCQDEMETGDKNDPCDTTFTLSIYNIAGTEGNDLLDDGEEWFDWGSDWCPDSLENGEGFCIAELAPCHCLDVPGDDLGYDPNNDNADPAGDDWHEINNPDSTEGNHKWDSGEPFYDWGLDGLPEDFVGYSDEFEGNDTLNWTDKNNNGIWEQGEGEKWFDTGADGKFNEEEVEDYNKWTEGNFKYDLGERFSDCGEDNFCNDTEGDDDTDDYNNDPNEDNWNDYGTDGIQSLDVNNNGNYDDANDIAKDDDNTENNGDWDEGEGLDQNKRYDDVEEFNDWGLDGIQDTLEAFQESASIPIERYDYSYIFDLDEEILPITPDLETDTVSLWISEIRKVDDNSLNIEVSVQSNKALKGLQFQLYHTPYTKVYTTLETYTLSIPQSGEDKLFEDFTLLPKKNYSDEELIGQLLIEYSNDLSTFLDFDNLNLFLENEEYIFSHQYSNLVFYIDSTNSAINEEGMWVYVTHEDDSGEDKILITKKVTSLSDSVEIAMGQILRAYQSGSITSYNGLKLKVDGNLYNYSKLSIKKNPRIDVMYSQ